MPTEFKLDQFDPSAFLTNEQALAEKRRKMQEAAMDEQGQGQGSFYANFPATQPMFAAGKQLGAYLGQRFAKLTPEEAKHATAVERANAEYEAWENKNPKANREVKSYTRKFLMAKELSAAGQTEESMQLTGLAIQEQQQYESQQQQLRKGHLENRKLELQIQEQYNMNHGRTRGEPSQYYPQNGGPSKMGVWDSGTGNIVNAVDGSVIFEKGTWLDSALSTSEKQELGVGKGENIRDAQGRIKTDVRTLEQQKAIREEFGAAITLMQQGVDLENLVQKHNKDLGVEEPTFFDWTGMVSTGAGRVLNFTKQMDLLLRGPSNENVKDLVNYANRVHKSHRLHVSSEDLELTADEKAKGLTSTSQALITDRGESGPFGIGEKVLEDVVIGSDAGNKQYADILDEWFEAEMAADLDRTKGNQVGIFDEWLVGITGKENLATVKERILRNKADRSAFLAKMINITFATMRIKEPNARQFSDLDFKNAMKLTGASATNIEEFRRVYSENVQAAMDAVQIRKDGLTTADYNTIVLEPLRNRYNTLYDEYFPIYGKYSSRSLGRPIQKSRESLPVGPTQTTAPEEGFYVPPPVEEGYDPNARNLPVGPKITQDVSSSDLDSMGIHFNV